MKRFSRPWITALACLASVAGVGEREAHAAACCGSSAALPSLLSGDDRYQVSLSSSNGSVRGDAPVSGLPVFRSSSSSDTTRLQRLDFGMLLTDRLQASISATLVTRTLQTRSTDASATSLGDPSFGIAYEAWPEWEFTQWTPRGFLFLQLTPPFARSIFNSARPDALDAVGTGFFRMTLGALFLKVRGDWDYTILPELHHSLSRTFQTAEESSILVRPGSGASLLFSTGYNFPRLPVRVGVRMQPSWNSGRYTEQSGSAAVSSEQWVQNTGADLAWMPNPENAVTIAYTDQTLFGPAINTTLSRTLAVQLQHRWPR